MFNSFRFSSISLKSGQRAKKTSNTDCKREQLWTEKKMCLKCWNDCRQVCVYVEEEMRDQTNRISIDSSIPESLLCRSRPICANFGVDQRSEINCKRKESAQRMKWMKKTQQTYKKKLCSSVFPFIGMLMSTSF